MSEILEEGLGILIKKEYLKNETKTVGKRKSASYLLYLKTYATWTKVVPLMYEKDCASYAVG